MLYVEFIVSRFFSGWEGFFLISVCCRSLLLYPNFKFKHHWECSHQRFSELSIVGNTSDFIKNHCLQHRSSCCCTLSFKNIWPMKHRPVQTHPKISGRANWNLQQEVTKVLQMISMHFPAPFLTSQNQQIFHGPEKKKAQIYTQIIRLLSWTIKVLIPKNLEWHQNKR